MRKLILFFGVFLPVYSSAAIVGQNLLTNGDFETGTLDGWVNDGIEVISSNASGFNQFLLPEGTLGDFMVTGGAGNASGQSIYQIVDLSENSTDIDNGTMFASVSGLLQAFTYDFIDLKISYFDENDQNIFQYIFSEPLTPVPQGASADGGWTDLNEIFEISKGTRSIMFEIEMTRNLGLFSDSVADNLVLEINPVPLPATIWLFLSGILPLIYIRKKVNSKNSSEKA